MSNFTQIKKIHTLTNILGLEDEIYRDMLASFGVGSSKNLTETEAQILIEILEDKVSLKENSHKKYDDFKSRDNSMATPAQLRKIEVVWKDMHTFTDKDSAKKSLRKFIKKQFHIEDIRFITKIKAGKIIAVLEKIKIKKYLKAL